MVIQANANVVALEPSIDSTFDYWLRISTLEKHKPTRVPVKLAGYHRKALEGKTINSSMTLNRRTNGWWLTLSYEEKIVVQTEPNAQVSMKFKARAMNAYLRASNLARIPEKIAWETAKRGMRATKVKSAYSSQECSICH